MSLLSDTIEQFIKSMLTEYEGTVEIQRNELAQHFHCAPSQINYVLATRFNLDKGYVVESRKGGGGYIRVIRVDIGENDLFDLVTRRIGTAISQKDALNIIGRLEELQSITQREAALIRSAVSDDAFNIPLALKDHLRANVLKNMIISLLKEED